MLITETQKRVAQELVDALCISLAFDEELHKIADDLRERLGGRVMNFDLYAKLVRKYKKEQKKAKRSKR